MTDTGGTVIGAWALDDVGVSQTPDPWSVAVPAGLVPVSRWSIPGMVSATVTGPGTGGRYRVNLANVSAELLFFDGAPLDPGRGTSWES